MAGGSALGRTLRYFKDADYDEARVAFQMVTDTMNKRKTSSGHVFGASTSAAAKPKAAKKTAVKKAKAKTAPAPAQEQEVLAPPTQQSSAA